MLLIVILCWTAITSGAKGHSGDDLSQWFLEEAPGRWKEYQSFTGHLHGTVTCLSKLDGQTYEHKLFTFKHNSKCRSLSVQFLDKELAPAILFSYNPEYAFSLNRKGDRPWALTSLEMRREGLDSRNVAETSENSAILRILVRALDTDLTDLVRQNSFRVLRATRVVRDEAELVKVEFDNSHPMVEEGKPFCEIQAGEMLLEPKRFWVLHAGNFRCKWGNAEAIVTVESQLAEPQGKNPVPRRFMQTSNQVRAEGRLTLTVVSQYALHEAKPLLPDSEFTLSTFG